MITAGQVRPRIPRFPAVDAHHLPEWHCMMIFMVVLAIHESFTRHYNCYPHIRLCIYTVKFQMLRQIRHVITQLNETEPN
jgi:hypothetical protein